MPAFYSTLTVTKTAALIQRRLNTSNDYAQKLAIAALDGIESHGGNPNDWKTINETVKVVVSSWVKNSALK